MKTTYVLIFLLVATVFVCSCKKDSSVVEQFNFIPGNHIDSPKFYLAMGLKGDTLFRQYSPDTLSIFAGINHIAITSFAFEWFDRWANNTSCNISQFYNAKGSSTNYILRLIINDTATPGNYLFANALNTKGRVEINFKAYTGEYSTFDSTGTLNTNANFEIISRELFTAGGVPEYNLYKTRARFSCNLIGQAGDTLRIRNAEGCFVY